MRASRSVLRLSLLGALLAVGGGCELDRDVAPDPPEVLPSGTATVFGRAVDTNFDFSAGLVTAVYEEREGALLLDLNLCEVGCGLLGVELEPESRAVLLNVETTAAGLVAGAVFEVPAELFALAAYRAREADLFTEAFLTSLEGGQSGTLTIDAVELRPGGTIRGRFDLALQLGGALTGSFEAPLLNLQETGEGR